MTEPLISSGDPVPIMPSIEGRIGDRLRNRAHIGAARAVPRPIHFEVVDLAPFPIGDCVLRGRSQGVFGDWVPRTRHIDPNPFNACVRGAIDDVVLKVSWQGPSCSAIYGRIEHINQASRSRSKEKRRTHEDGKHNTIQDNPT